MVTLPNETVRFSPKKFCRSRVRFTAVRTLPRLITRNVSVAFVPIVTVWFSSEIGASGAPGTANVTCASGGMLASGTVANERTRIEAVNAPRTYRRRSSFVRSVRGGGGKGKEGDGGGERAEDVPPEVELREVVQGRRVTRPEDEDEDRDDEPALVSEVKGEEQHEEDCTIG